MRSGKGAVREDRGLARSGTVTSFGSLSSLPHLSEPVGTKKAGQLERFKRMSHSGLVRAEMGRLPSETTD